MILQDLFLSKLENGLVPQVVAVRSAVMGLVMSGLWRMAGDVFTRQVCYWNYEDLTLGVFLIDFVSAMDLLIILHFSLFCYNSTLTTRNNGLL